MERFCTPGSLGSASPIPNEIGKRESQPTSRYARRSFAHGPSPRPAKILKLRRSPTTKKPHSITGVGRVERLREQDSNLQPCGYGILQSFRFGPDYLIILSESAEGGRAEGRRALSGLIGEYPHPLVSARSPLQTNSLCGASLRIALPP